MFIYFESIREGKKTESPENQKKKEREMNIIFIIIIIIIIHLDQCEKHKNLIN